jgi:hypothetical protein
MRLDDVRLDDLRRMFDVPPGGPMYECYPVQPEQADYFQRALGVQLDFGKYDFYVECHDVSRGARAPEGALGEPLS